MTGPIPDPARLALFSCFILIFCGLALILALATDRTVWAEHEIDISGTIKNGTEGAEAPAGLEVLLHRFGDAGEIDVVTAVVEEDGSYIFRSVEPADSGSYAVTASYQGVLYSAPVELPLGSESAELLVYEVVESIDVISLEANVMLIGEGPDNRSFSVLEAVSVINDGDRTFIPDLDQPANFNFMRFSLPEGATDLDVGSDLPGGEIINIGTGFALTAPVTPGIHQVTYTYGVPYSGASADVSRSFPMGVDSFRLLIQEGLGEVDSSEFVGLPVVDVGGAPYSSWEATELNPGDRVAFQVSDLPSLSWWERTKDNLGEAIILKVGIPIVLAAVLIGLLLFALIFPRWRGRAPIAASPPTSLAPADANDADIIAASTGGREQLVQEIADLDDLYQQDGIGESEYHSRRASLKDRLLQIALAEGLIDPGVTEEEIERGESGVPGTHRRQQEQGTET